MKDAVTGRQFRKDVRRAEKRGLDLAKLADIVDLLVEEEPLPRKQRDHALSGQWKGTRECHIAPDWLLIYETDDETVTLRRTGTHSVLFDE